MRFTELRESVEATQVQSVHEYHQIYLNKDILSSLEGLNGEYLRHLFSDLICRIAAYRYYFCTSPITRPTPQHRHHQPVKCS